MQRPWEKHYSENALAFDPASMDSRTLPQLIDQAAQRFGDKPAMTTVLPNGIQGSVSYADLHREAEHFAAYLREVLGLQTGDAVAVMTPNCNSFGVAALGIFKAGCIATFVNPLYTVPELEHQLTDSAAKVLVIIDLFGDKVDAVIDKTPVEHVVTLSLLEFFPAPQRAFVNFIMKRVKKVVPAMRTPAVSMKQALAEGRRAAAGADIGSYTVDVSPTDTALYQYTSGTTGRSKGAMLHHQGIISNAQQGRLMAECAMGPDGETALVALPLYHITAFVLLFVSGLLHGGHGVLIPSPRPPANMKAALTKHRITWVTGINTLYAALLAEPWFDRKLFENVRFFGSGGAAQHVGVARKWEEQTGFDIKEGYGMSECCGVLTVNPPDNNRLGTVGVPVPGMEVRIVDDAGVALPPNTPGEVVLRGPTMMKGYLNRPDATAETIKDGWLYSGDIGVMDEDGFVQIVDRKKDMILVSGFNVSPNEIEDAISAMPEVVQVGVIGVPDDRSGEVPMAFVVRGDETLTEDAVVETCRGSLTNYKIPKKVLFVSEVPMTLSGKVLRRQLREEYLS
ncbi:MAG: AMP-binding protein [Pseudomonadota bacterium]